MSASVEQKCVICGVHFRPHTDDFPFETVCTICVEPKALIHVIKAFERR